MLSPSTPRRPGAAHVRDEGVDPGVVEAHPVDQRLALRQPEHARLRIAGLRPRRDGADLDEAEAHRRQRVDVRAVLVQPGRQADAVAKAQPHHFDRVVDRAASHQPQRAAARRPIECAERQLVRVFGIEREQQRPRQRVRIHRAQFAPSLGARRPRPVDQALDRPEVALVGHLRALCDLVAEVEVRQVQMPALLDLPQDVVGAVAGAARRRVEEGVDRRQAVVEDVDDRHHPQRAVGVAELDQPRVDLALQQELRVLLAAVVIHAAAGMPARLVAQVQRVVLGREAEPRHQRPQAARAPSRRAAGCASASNATTGTRTGTQALQPSQCGR